ncbi:MAG: DUF58 domain-containing protein [Spirochaetales bacterium]
MTQHPPNSLKNLYILSRRLVEELLGGSYRSVFRGPGIEFSDVRLYTEEDDARLIDWNVTARVGNPYTRLYREERELVLFFILDVSASVFYGREDWGKRRLQQTLVSLLSFCAIRNNDKVGAMLFSDRIEIWIPPRKGKKHVFRLIQDLLDFQPEGKGSDLATALKTVGANLKKRAIIFLISDFKMGGYYKELALVSKKHDVIGVRMYDPWDEEFPSLGYLPLKDPETGEFLPSFGISRTFKEEYNSYRLVFRRMWWRDCVKLGVDLLEIGTEEDPGIRLIEFFQRRRKYR